MPDVAQTVADRRDRDRLFAALAAQCGLADRGELEAALAEAESQATIGRVLLARGAIDEPRLAMMESLTESFLAIHGGDVQVALAALPESARPGAAVDPEATVADPFATLAGPEPAGPAATIGYGPAPGRDPGPEAGPVDPEATQADPFATVAHGAEATQADPLATRPYEDLYATVAHDPGATQAHGAEATAPHDPEATSPFSAPGSAGPAGSAGSGASPTRGPGTGPRRPGGGPTGAPGTGLRFVPVRKHAQGGLGEIFVAVDGELGREVALKEIKDRFADHTESRVRFQFEAEVTGGLEHPGIVPVYGLGRYADGRPYYAMRFIRGQTLKAAIKDFHDPERGPKKAGERALALVALIRRFLDVCNAIEYAHGRRVLHRDLKPDNIMLGPYGETLVVDWGLAKPLDRPDLPIDPDLKPLRPTSGDSMVVTQHGTTVGTPAYMPPEQAAGDLDQMGPAADIYSLGATLYHVLAGQPPFTGNHLATVLRNVREGAYPPARQIVPTVPPALEAIVAKAMALRPADRYPTARDLATDLERWLADEPVAAYPEPFAARAARWARRHRTAVLAGATLGAATIVAMGIGTVLVGRERDRTQRTFVLARSAVRDMLTNVADVDLADVPQMEGVRGRLLAEARDYYQAFLKLRGAEGSLRREAGLARARLATTLELLGDYREAEVEFVEALRLLEEVDGGTEGDRRDFAGVAHSYGTFLKKARRDGQAEIALRNALRLRELLVAAHPDSAADRQAAAESRYQLAALLARQGGRGGEDEALYKQALDEQRELVRADRERPEARAQLARTLNNVGILLRAQGRDGEAEAAFREAEAMQLGLITGAPTRPGYRWQLARTDSNLGLLLADTGRPADALTALNQALDQQRLLAADYPGVPDYRQELAAILTNLGLVIARQGRSAEAVPLYQEAIGLLDELIREAPQVPDHRLRRAVAEVNLAAALRGDQSAEAEEQYRKAIVTLEALSRLYPRAMAYLGALGKAHADYARFLGDTGRDDEALAAFDRAIACQRQALSTDTRNARLRSEAAQAYLGRAFVLVDRKADPAGAAAAVAAAIIEAKSTEPVDHLQAAALLARCAEAAGKTDPSAAEEHAARAVAVLRDAVEARRIVVPTDLDDPAFAALKGRDDFKAVRQKLRSRVDPPIG